MVSFDWNCWNQRAEAELVAAARQRHAIFVGVQIARDVQIASVVAARQADLRLRVRCRAAADHHRAHLMSQQKSRNSRPPECRASARR